MTDVTIKQIPVGTRTYYSNAKKNADNNIIKAKEEIDNLLKLKDDAKNIILKNKQFYIDKSGLNVIKYDEFNENKYINGKFESDVKIAFNLEDYEGEDKLNVIVIHRYVSILRNIDTNQKDIVKFEKIKTLSYKEYTELVSAYYKEVQKQLIFKGYGYLLPNGLGWICINRVRNTSKKDKVNFAETAKAKQKLIDEGKTPYNKEDAKFCEENGIKYDGVPYTVYIHNDYFYEICLCNPKIPVHDKARFETADWRHRSLRGKTNEDLLNEANGNVGYIMNLPIDIRLKVNLISRIDKTLYLNFIRNEHQETFTNRKVGGKD